MLFNVLATNQSGSWIMLVVLAAVLIVFMVINRRSQKKRQEEQNNTLNAIKPGNKVKTIGGICGIVVEVCDDDTFVIETGSEKSGKSYVKFDKQAIYQTDAVAKPAVAAEKPAATEEKAEEPASETTEEQSSKENK